MMAVVPPFVVRSRTTSLKSRCLVGLRIVALKERIEV